MALAPSATDASAALSAPPVSMATKLFYGAGSIAFGVKDQGFQVFLLLFYNQMVGLPSAWVGGAIFLALMVDAVMDPVVGQMSDHWHSRWGRRHPFMYLSALPVALSYIALWNPPHGSQQIQFIYLVVVAVIVRTFITFFEIPSSALAPELTTDYDERTKILGYRYMFGWVGGLSMVILAYGVFLRPTAQYPVGQLNPVGYAHYGLMSAGVMFAAIIISALGTHKRIPYLRQPPKTRPAGLVGYAKEMAATLSHRSFAMVAIGGLFAAMGQGVNFASLLYVGTYFWELTSTQIQLLTAQAFVGAALAMTFAPMISGRFGKRQTTVVAIALSAVIGVSPIVLRMLGLFPANHTAMLFPTLLGFALTAGSMNIASSILISSMIADVVEDSELRTGRRSEGLFFAANSLVQKAVSGTGPLIAGVMLAVIHFPAKAQPGHVPQTVLHHLGLIYPVLYLAPYAAALWFLSRYRIDRATHEDNLRRLAAVAEAVAEGEPA